MTSKQKMPLAFLIAVSIVHLVLLTFRISRDALWLDEMMSLSVAGGSLEEAVRFFQTMPAQHPLYYAILRAWMAFGDSDLWVRLLSAAFAVLGLWACYLLARELFGDLVAKVATLLLTFSPFYLYFGREARMYSLLVFLAMVSSLLFLRFMRSCDIRQGSLYVVVCVLGMYTHVLFAFLIISHVLFSLAARPGDRQTAVRSFAAASTVLVLYLPWLRLILLSPSTLAGQGWKGGEHVVFGIPYTFLRFLLGYSQFLPNFQWKSRVGALLLESSPLLLLAATVFGVLSVAGSRRAWRTREQGLFLLTNLCGPMVIALVVSIAVVVLMGERYLIISYPFFVILMALGIMEVVKGPRRVAGLAVTAGYAFITVVALYSFYFDPRFGKEQWKSVATELEMSSKADDVVALESDVVRNVLLRYYEPPPGQRVERASQESQANTEQPERLWLVLAHADVAHPPEAFVASNWPSRSVVRCLLFPKHSGIRLLLLERGSSEQGVDHWPACSEVL